MKKYLYILALVHISLVALAQQDRPRVIISTDIGGTDPDDFQSMIHYLMYADKFETEGLISSPYGEGRASHIFRMLDLYEKDYPKLKVHSKLFPTPNQLRKVTKQGALNRAPGKGWDKPSEGSEWIIECARKESSRPLWVLVWGGLDDLAQSLHDAPEIADNLRVYWIGGPNKKWSSEAYQFIVKNFPNLWIIESNATYRGWFEEDSSSDLISNKDYYGKYIQGNGAMGKDFKNHYGGEIKMGDSPSVGYLLFGTPENPENPSWGGSYIPLKYSSRRVFERETTLKDEVPVFGMVEWVFNGPDIGSANDEPCLWLEIDNQKIEGYYEGAGVYRVRFVPKGVGTWTYKIHSTVAEIDGRDGQFTSTDPWPGPENKDDIKNLNTWWSDRIVPDSYAGKHQGAKTIARWRNDFLMDWAERWSWLAR